MLRVAGALVACAVTWQTGGPAVLLGQEGMSCCIKAHDNRKCPCRYCLHDRSPVPLLETCGLDRHAHQVVATVLVFAPLQVNASLPPRAPAAMPQGAPAAAMPDRALEVPTPPPLA